MNVNFRYPVFFNITPDVKFVLADCTAPV